MCLSLRVAYAVLPAFLFAVASGACASTSHDGSAASQSNGDASSGEGDGPNVDGSGDLGEPGDSGGGGFSISGPSDGGAKPDAGHTQACTDAGCTCIRIASIGHEGIWGACGQGGDSTSALVSWLNTQSTAAVDTYDTTKPTLTPTFLGQYDVIILQWLRDVSDAGSDGNLWQFSADEVSALAAWVSAGGGLITLSGYDGDGAEVTPVNTLLSFTAFSYNMDGTSGSDWAGGSCWGGASGLTGWNTATPIGAHIKEVGVQFGRSISVATDAGSSVTVDCPCSGNPNQCAVHQDIGKGHVFSFTDEWVTYTSQWAGSSPCIASTCTNTPATAFQVPQFWYNAISYAASAVQCFTIQSPMIVY